MHIYFAIFIPGQPPPEGFAVMVWIHPGNFKSGNPEMWNPYSLVFKQRVIVVTIAYRLNILGFFTTMDGEAIGNYGLMDQVAALKWIKSNIEHFGGNANSICLMGSGSGAVSVGIHMVSPDSKGLFTKAIAMSGNLLSPDSVKYPQDDKAIVDEIAGYFGCFRYPTSLLLDCLKRAPAEQLVRFGLEMDWKPIIDNGLSNNTTPFLSEQPKNYFERGDFNKVPFLTGFTDMEEVLTNVDMLHSDDTDAPEEYLSQVLNYFVNKDLPQVNSTDTCVYNHEHILDSVLFFYRPQPPAKSHSEMRKTLTDFITEKNYGSTTYQLAQYVSKFKPTYMYRFDMKPTTDGAVAELPSWVSVPHLFDLIYLWGMPYWSQIPTQQEWDIRDKRVSDIIMNFWTNFAKSSNPTESSIFAIKWDEFKPDSPGILIIDRTFNMSSNIQLNYKSFEFWNNYYPKVIDIATQCCNATSNAFNIIPSLATTYIYWLFYFTFCLNSILHTFM